MTLLGRTAGRALSRALAAGPGRRTLAEQRLQLRATAARLGASKRAGRSWWSPPRLGLALAGAGALAMVVALWWPTAASKPALGAAYAGRSVAEAVELRAGEGVPELLEFSDGSRMLLEERTSAALSRLTPERADLTLRDGRITASIRQQSGVTWTVAAGPYSVRVVGTKFSVDWDEPRQRLRVHVEEGRVRVSGGDLPGPGVALGAGSELEQRYAPRVENRDQPPAPEDTAAAEVEPAGTGAKPPSVTTRGAVQATPAETEQGQPGSWKELASNGRYQDALARAKQYGFQRLLATLPENDLLTLANAARYGGDAERARQALHQLRQRFPGGAAAQLAALYLARVAEDMDKQPAEAERWLRTFLRESPTGDLAASARASLISILLGMGDARRAATVAEDYLRHHAGGPHAEKARSVIRQARAR